MAVPATPSRADRDDAEPAEDPLDPSRVNARRRVPARRPATAKPVAIDAPRRRGLHRVVLWSLAVLLALVATVVGREWLRAPTPAGGSLPVSQQAAAPTADLARPAAPPPARDRRPAGPSGSPAAGGSRGPAASPAVTRARQPKPARPARGGRGGAAEGPGAGDTRPAAGRVRS